MVVLQSFLDLYNVESNNCPDVCLSDVTRLLSKEWLSDQQTSQE